MFQAISYRKLGNKSDMYFLYSNFFDAFFLTNLMGCHTKWISFIVIQEYYYSFKFLDIV